MKTYICIDIEEVREELRNILNEKKLSDAQSDAGKMFNAGIALSYFEVDTYLLRLYKEYREGIPGGLR